MASVTANPYLQGNFAPIRQETTAEDLTVVGELPIELSGMFVRNGPNPQFPPKGQYHWFDGDGMLHAVHLQQGKAAYRNRYIRTQGFQVEQQAGQAIWTGLLEPVQVDNPYGPYKNTANTALVRHSDRLLALWEGGTPHAISVPNLETIGIYTFQGQLTCPFTAHPKIDPKTREMMFFGYQLFEPPYLHYGTVSADGELQRIISIDLPVGVMMHDFAITEHYTIFLDFPLTFRPERAQQGEPMMMFERDRPTRIGILPRHGDNNDIVWLESSPAYAFHVLNAYEQGDEVILIACRQSSTDVLAANSSNPDDPEANIPFLHRWRINLSTKTVQEERLDEIPCEFPRINEQYMGRPTRYGYAGQIVPGSIPLFDGILKFDFQRGSTQTHAFGEGRYGGEAVFVPRPQASAEDDGWLMTFVHDEGEQTSELVVIDAQAIADEPVARVLIPQRVPYGFHATWLGLAQ